MSIKVFTPKTVEEAAVMIKEEGGKILAGGTDLIIELQKEQVSPGFMVDMGAITELKNIEVSNDTVKLGSMVTFAQLIENEYIRVNVPSLWEAARKMGATQIQNRATIGGNICNAAPAADSIPVFMSIHAQCIICGQNGRKTMPINEFVLGRGKISLNEGEVLEAVVFNKPGADTGLGFAKLGKRNALAISTISCAVRLTAVDGQIIGAAVFSGSLGTKSEEEIKAEAYLKGKMLAELNLEEAAAVLSKEVEERLGSRASIVYKKEAVKGIFKEAVEMAIKQLSVKKGGVL